MVRENGDRENEGGKKRVLDEEGTVDQEAKKSILDARDRVAERHDELFIQAPIDDAMSVSPEEQVVSWGSVVKQYLIRIEPLLRHEDVFRSQYYYRQHELGSVTLTPRDTDVYPFEKVATGAIAPQQFRIQYNVGNHVDLPEQIEQRFVGLKDVIDSEEHVSHTWTVETGTFSDPREGGVVTTSDAKPVPKQVYENAVRAADQFLFDIDIGVDVGAPEREVHPDPI